MLCKSVMTMKPRVQTRPLTPNLPYLRDSPSVQALSLLAQVRVFVMCVVCLCACSVCVLCVRVVCACCACVLCVHAVCACCVCVVCAAQFSLYLCMWLFVRLSAWCVCLSLVPYRQQRTVKNEKEGMLHPRPRPAPAAQMHAPVKVCVHLNLARQCTDVSIQQ